MLPVIVIFFVMWKFCKLVILLNHALSKECIILNTILTQALSQWIIPNAPNDFYSYNILYILPLIFLCLVGWACGYWSFAKTKLSYCQLISCKNFHCSTCVWPNNNIPLVCGMFFLFAILSLFVFLNLIFQTISLFVRTYFPSNTIICFYFISFFVVPFFFWLQEYDLTLQAHPELINATSKMKWNKGLVHRWKKIGHKVTQLVVGDKFLFTTFKPFCFLYMFYFLLMVIFVICSAF